MTAFLVYDVFTDAPFGGNQLAVVPDARDVPGDRLQAIAREFGFSETIFLYPGEPWRARIFTPMTELPFAGHPTVGAGVAMAEMGLGTAFDLELGIGVVRIEAGPGRAAFTVTRPLEVAAEVPARLVARALSLDPSRVTGRPVLAGVGANFVLAELADRPALSACRPDVEGFRAIETRLGTHRHTAVYPFVRDGGDLHARMFLPLDGIWEDPATGSAAAGLAAWLAREEPVDLVIHQGHDMGRPSRIEVSAGPSGVRVAGRAVRTMEGRLLV